MAKTLLKFRFLFFLLVCVAGFVTADEQLADSSASATYLGNEGVLIETKFGKVLFDPFFHNDFGYYTLVPDELREAIFTSKEPYDGIAVIIISHAHGDHFSAQDSLRYLSENPESKLIGPLQAVEQILALAGAQSVEHQLVGVSLQLGDPAIVSSIGEITIESLRIPHAGWPARKEISNLVHRVTFGADLNVIHMGDADPNDLHFKPYQKLWEKSVSEIAFPPYWFFTSRQGPMILSERINAIESVGVHVPTVVPNDLRALEKEYFSTPGQTRQIFIR